MDVEGRRGIDEKLVVDWEEEVDKPRSRVVEALLGEEWICSSWWDCSGKVADPWSGFGDSFLRLRLGWRGREKLSDGACDCECNDSGVCRPSEECDL